MDSLGLIYIRKVSLFRSYVPYELRYFNAKFQFDEFHVLKAAVSAGLECVRTLTQAKLSVYVYACSKQTVVFIFRPGIGKKEVFAGTVAFSRHSCRVVWCV